MSFNHHQGNGRGYPYASGQGFVHPHVTRGRGRPREFGNAATTPGYGQQPWEYQQPTSYPQIYGGFPINHRHYDHHPHGAPQQLPPPATFNTWHPWPPYPQPPGAAANHIVHREMNSNSPQYEEQTAHRGMKRKNNAGHAEQTNTTHVASQAVFSGRRGNMSQVNTVDHGINFAVLKAKGRASFLNREAAIQAIEGMFQQGEPVTLSWNAGLSTAPPNTELQMQSNVAKRQRIVSARDRLALERLDPQIYFKLKDTNTRCKAATMLNQSGPGNAPTICGNCQESGHTVAMCHRVRENGFIYGCAICNSSRHSTWKCPEFPKNDKLEMIHLLVFNRANMPPLMGKFWYALLFDYMRDNPTTLVPGLPWTLQHSKRFYISWDVRDPFLLSQHDRAVEQLGGVDPRTASWANTKVYYGGDISAGRGKKSKATQGQRLWN